MDTTVLVGGRIITCDERGSIAEAIAIRDGRVLAVGDSDTVRAQAGTGARVADLGGGIVIPGLIDTHPHLMHFGALAEPLVDLTDVSCHEDIVARIAARAAVTPPGEWIMTTPVGEPHYFIRRSYRDLVEGVLPHRDVLDRAAPRHPVFIQAWAPVVPNVCAMNSLALDLLDIGHATPDRVGDVWIEKDAAGRPTGRLHGSVTNYYCDDPFMNGLLRRLPLLQPEAIIPGTRRAMRAFNALGVTAVYEAHLMTFSLIEFYRSLRDQDQLTLRVLCAPEAEPFGVVWSDPLQPPGYRERLDRARDLTDRSDHMFRVDGVTVSPYGPCWPGFARMREAYQDPYGRQTRGRSTVSLEKVGQAIRYCHEKGVRLNIVTSGQAETDGVLGRLEELGHVPLTTDGRAWLLQHFSFAEPDLVRRAAALGLDITTTMSFSWGKGELVRERFGDHLLPDFIPLARLLDSGLHVAAGTDWGPKNVFEHIALAVEPRYAADGDAAATPGISRRRALAMWTSEAAHVLRWDDIGSLRPGNHADLVILDRDPLACPLDELPGTQVVTTMLGGKTVTGPDPTE
ncbi:amidohydrolase [Microbispora rosea]|uniref:amidohydrolase n=1 Tax=Microbispora rosea TaxID=58117 RepID=UPI003D8A059F